MKLLANQIHRVRKRTETQVAGLSTHPGMLVGLAASTPIVAAALLSSAKRSRASTAPQRSPIVVASDQRRCDLVLSSGFLSFANHAGFLKAVEEAGLEIDGLMGTSAGALSGSLYAAGYSPERIAEELSRLPPSSYLQVSTQPWEGGVLNMDKVIDRYRELLPATFEELKKDFAVGVCTRDGRYIVVDSGPLPEAVVASAAIPVVFENVEVPGLGPCMDGGKHDRVGLTGWQGRQRDMATDDTSNAQLTLVHLISRSSPFSGNEAVATNDNVVLLRSPKSGVSLTSLGDFQEHYDGAYNRSRSQLAEQIRCS